MGHGRKAPLEPLFLEVRGFPVQRTVAHDAALSECSPTETGLNLEAWCWRCNMDHAQSSPIDMIEERKAFAHQFDPRVHAGKPMWLCDDPIKLPIISHDLMRTARLTK
jgi:hypothetical protein